MTTEDITNTSTKTDQIAEATADARPAALRDDPTRQLLAKARYDAFKLMTETSQEAEDILVQARTEAAGTLKAADISAEAIVEKAKANAQATITSATEEGAAIVAKAHRSAGEEATPPDTTELLNEHRNLTDRVSTRRTLANQLEDRFAALASTTGGAQSKTTEPKTVAAPTTDHSPSMAPETSVETKEEKSPVSDGRGSFYNRRSANLPRLGKEDRESVAAMTRNLRKPLNSD